MKASDTNINESEVAGKIGGYFGVLGSDPRIAPLLAKVFPEVKLAARGDPSGWQSALVGVMAKYEGLAKELGLGVLQTQRDFEALRTANRTDATFAGAAGRLGLDGLRQYAATHGGSTGSEDRDGSSRSGAMSSTAYARETPLTVSGAIGFAKELGMNPANAAFFERGSAEMRNAIRDAIKCDRAITEDKIKDMHDVSMVIGAIRSGKIKEDDPKVPDSVRKVIKQMREDGIDPVKGDSKAVKKYLDEHPKALEQVRKSVEKDKSASVTLNTDDLAAAAKKEAEKVASNATKKKAPAKKIQPVPQTL
ncbi:hypothetical protein [uncultured Bradyrhizobium sp.]|uniref:hypothetical protein n=1 Tax=uncultured Bradyrhizobium sp. TaxID=199684 RepID=UPI0035CC4210